MDFTLENQLIKDYLEGDDSYIPKRELMYLHVHPLVTPNFMTELSAMIVEAGEIMLKYKIYHYSDKLTACAIRLGKELPTITDDNAEMVLKTFRELYQLCNELKTKLP